MPTVNVQLPDEMGGMTRIPLRAGESPEQAIDRRVADIQGHQPGQDKATFLEGIGSGMLNTGRQVGNIFGMDNDKEIADQAEIDQGLGGWGQAGKLAGEVIATLPAGGGIGAAGKGLGRAALAARRAGSIGKAPARALASTLKSRLGRGVVEGAGHGALFAGPDRRGEGAAMGAAMGGGVSALGKVAGAAGRKFKLTEISDEARAVQELTGHHIPLSQAAKPGTIKMIYNAFLANVPGVGGKYRAKYTAALQDFRHFAATEAHPNLGDIDIPNNASMGQIFEKLGKFWDKAYEPLNNTMIKVSRLPTPPKFLAGMLAKSSRELQHLPKPGQMKAGKLRELQQAIRAMVGKEDNPKVVAALKKYADDLEKVMERGMPKTPEGGDIWDAYKALREPYRNWVDLQAAGLKASGSEFSAKQLETAARRGVGTNLREDRQSVLQKAGEMGAKTLEDFPSKQGLFQTVAALGLGGGIAAGAGIPVAAGMGTIIGAGKIMTTEVFEKLISGQSNHLQKNARALKAAGYALREIAVILGLEEEDAT